MLFVVVDARLKGSEEHELMQVWGLGFVVWCLVFGISGLDLEFGI